MPVNKLRNSRFLTFLLINAIFLTVITVSFAAKKDKKKGVVMTEIELQSELMSYADRFVSIMAQALEDFEALNPSREAHRRIVVRKEEDRLAGCACEPRKQEAEE